MASRIMANECSGCSRNAASIHPAVLFVYDTADSKVQLIDLKKQFAHVVTASFNITFDVVGATETGAIVR